MFDGLAKELASVSPLNVYAIHGHAWIEKKCLDVP